VLLNITLPFPHGHHRARDREAGRRQRSTAVRHTVADALGGGGWIAFAVPIILEERGPMAILTHDIREPKETGAVRIAVVLATVWTNAFVATCLLAPRASPVTIARLNVWLIAVLVATTAAYVVGQAVVGWAAGFHISTLHVGFGPSLLELGPGPQVVVRAIPLRGWVVASLPEKSASLRSRLALFAAGGPMAALLVAAAAAAIVSTTHGEARLAVMLVFAVGVAIAGLNLIPSDLPRYSDIPVRSDGRFLFGAWRLTDADLDELRAAVPLTAGCRLVRQGRLADALPHLEAAFALAPARAGVWLGVALVRLERWAAAVPYLRGCEDPGARLALAWALVMLGEPGQFAEADALTRDDALTTFRACGVRGAVLVRLGEFDAAIPLLERSMAAPRREPPWLAQTRCLLAEIALARGDLDAADAELARAAVLSERLPRIAALRAEVARRRG
jgi:hypothetical protein